MISKELRESIQKMEKLQQAMKNIHLLDLLPEIFENQEKLTKYVEKIDKLHEKFDKMDEKFDKIKTFKEKIETKEQK